jgi:hypothetical protein
LAIDGRQHPLRAYLEAGQKRVFAGAIDWPGWCRSGKSQDEAVVALLNYAPRYAKVAKSANVPFTALAADANVDVVERLAGGGGTDFGVPSVAPPGDSERLRGKELARQQALLEASWKAFDNAARSAKGRRLKTGPRGGGRTVEKMIDHVLEAEIAYLGQLGSRFDKAAAKDEMAAVRSAVLETLQAVAKGKPITNPRQTKRPWSPRYYVRRASWHALDHAWEIQDRLER